MNLYEQLSYRLMKDGGRDDLFTVCICIHRLFKISAGTWGRHLLKNVAHSLKNFGGNGITFSVIAAEILRDMIIGKKNEDAEIFQFNR